MLSLGIGEKILAWSPNTNVPALLDSGAIDDSQPLIAQLLFNISYLSICFLSYNLKKQHDFSGECPCKWFNINLLFRFWSSSLFSLSFLLPFRLLNIAFELCACLVCILNIHFFNLHALHMLPHIFVTMTLRGIKAVLSMLMETMTSKATAWKYVLFNRGKHPDIYNWLRKNWIHFYAPPILKCWRVLGYHMAIVRAIFLVFSCCARIDWWQTQNGESSGES